MVGVFGNLGALSHLNHELRPTASTHILSGFFYVEQLTINTSPSKISDSNAKRQYDEETKVP